MLTMHFLRLLADLSFYNCFASFVAAGFGSGGSWGGMLLCCLVYALSSLAGDRKTPRRLSLLPLLLCPLRPGHSPADLVLLLPELFYTVRLVWQGDYALSRERQLRVFSVFWKALAVSVPFVLLSGNESVRAAGLPFALVMLVSSVLLLRALRHDRSVYCRRGYQLADLSVMALTALAAWVLSSRQVLRAALLVLRELYFALVLPLLLLLLYAFTGLFRLLGRLLSLLKLRPPTHSSNNALDNVNPELRPDFGAVEEAGPLLRYLGLLLCAVAVAALLFLFFRWLSRGGPEKRAAPGREMSDRSPATDRPRPRRESPPIRSIRTQYRRYLRRFRERGAEIKRSSTSLDVQRQARYLGGLPETQADIRRIYTEARYGGRADREQAAEMRRLCAETKRQG